MNSVMRWVWALSVVGACSDREPDLYRASTVVAQASLSNDSTAKESRLGAADVSVLFPATDGAALWPASMETTSGPLLPREAFELNGRSLVREVEDSAEYDALRVVGMRFDPCFQHTLGGACEPQVRLVLQVPLATDEGSVDFADGAVHALYALTFERFEELVTALTALAAPTSAAAPDSNGNAPSRHAPLGVHPTLEREGVGGPFGSALASIAKAHLGPATLTRVTFMTRTAAVAGQWQFSGFEILDRRDKSKEADPKGQRLEGQRLVIAGVGVTMQNVTRDRHIPEADHIFAYTVHPLFADKSGRLGASGVYLAKASPEERQSVHAWALRQESPSAHLPDTTDCASCHLSNHVGRRVEAVSDDLLFEANRPDRVTSPAETDADNLRAFGYFGRHPQVAQRTANETAAVLRRLERPQEQRYQP